MIKCVFWRVKWQRLQKSKRILIEEGFPPLTLPTIFCDGIANLAPSGHVIKFYLFRSDPDQTGRPKYKNQTLARIIMPIPAFIYAGIFFENGLKQFVEQGTISQELVDNIKQAMRTERQK
jgi:hypothetical protein